MQHRMSAGRGADAEASSADDDPMAVLSRLRRPHTQRQNEDTRRLLEVGLELLNETLDERPEQGQPVSFRWPSKERVVERFNDRTGLQMSRAVLDDRWATTGDFAADLFAWALHRSQWSAHRTIAENAMAVIANTGALSAGARELARKDMTALLGAPIFRIKLLLCAVSSVEPPFATPMEDFYAAAIDWWGTVYAAILTAGDRRLRPDVDPRTFAMLMTAMEEGLALQLRAAPQLFANGLDSAAEALALGALGLFAGMTTDRDDNTNLTDYVDAQFGRPR